MAQLGHGEGLRGLQMSPMLVGCLQKGCVGPTHALMSLASKDASAIADVQAGGSIREREQGCGSPRVACLHQHAPYRSIGRRRGYADFARLGRKCPTA